jgi:hypothetical protein
MESIYRLVADSMARHGVEASNPEAAPLLASFLRSANEEPRLDHLRLDWSRWIRCESSCSFALAPAKPGIIALGEEMFPSASNLESRAPALHGDAGASPVGGRRMLALFQISETDDLGMALGRLFLPGNPLRKRLTAGRCFARYIVVEDASLRSAAYMFFQRWMRDSAETASGIQQQPCGADTLARDSELNASDIPVRAEIDRDVGPDSDVARALPPSISSAWGAGFMEVQNRDVREAIRRPQPLPSGF